MIGRTRSAAIAIMLAAPTMLLMSGCASSRRPADTALCRIETRPTGLPGHDGKGEPGRHAMRQWDVPLDAGWDTAVEPKTDGYARFRKSIQNGPNAEVQGHLLSARGDYNASLVSMAGKEYVKPASCFERAIYGDFMTEAVRDTKVNGFDGYVLENPTTRMVRALYELTPTEDANGPDPIDVVVAEQRRAGWSLLFEIHAHPVSRDAATNRSGAVAPTVKDAAYEARLKSEMGLREARITNGVVTARIPADAFHYFQSDE
ncbi:hypothetical protein [Sphingomonas oryzagri]|uniref:Lipoprotein n=1 Tax=Sphingomonas oryzagri TaxID=3042314 RepID=A0ABT6N590_9SPHN|nr:hypothetical protein [Sphingomonas oryzagri]MDH7640277.1 hypothetical protein [Sphingomonas oryzagri]